MKNIFLLLGSNLGDREKNLQSATNYLKNKITIIKSSSIYESEPWGVKDQPWFLNLILEIETEESPNNLLKICQTIENELGRKRIRKWGERTIDIDILYYGNHIIQTKDLKVPHIGIPSRKFTLMILNEIAPNFVHPELSKSSIELFDKCSDKLECKIR